MVTSNKLLDKKVVKMAEHNNSVVVVPQRTLLGEVNEHIMCPLCRGYYIDATTIVECLHSFCRSCIIKHLRDKSYCPVCEMMINSAKPNIKLDKALQDIVYKLVPGLFQKEMERRQQFYASRPGPAASATPEQRGEDTERIIFSPEDVISFSLEYIDGTDTDSISSKSSDSNESQHVPATTRRYLQCPAVVNISHLKKFLCMKFDIDTTQFDIDILYKRVPLPDYYTLMDIAYIYNWKRNEPMRFFYQIIDYIAIRNRLFDINSKGSHFQDRKSSPASTEDTNISSPAANLNDQGSEASSGTDSPMPDENIVKQTSDNLHSNFNLDDNVKDCNDKTIDNKDDSCKRSVDDDVEKSQFLISFELTAKSNNTTVKSPDKASTSDDHSNDSLPKIQSNLGKIEEKPQDSLKRKFQSPPNTPELKKLKIESDKAKIPNSTNSPTSSPVTTMPTTSSGSQKVIDTPVKIKDIKATQNSHTATATNNISTPTKETKQQSLGVKQHVFDASGLKRTLPQNSPTTTKRKPSEVATAMQQPQSVTQKNVSPLKQIPQSSVKPVDTPKPNLKKMPELKPSVPASQSSQIKNQIVNKVRMDLLANNSDPTIDRSKILSQVKTSLSNQSTSSGDPLKSLFDSCKINIPSSLSITLTDQKLEPRNPIETVKTDPKKSVVNKSLGSSSGLSHKIPCPPVHNYIEILKLPDTDSKKMNKTDGNSDLKLNQQNKMDNLAQGKPLNKSSESSAKGPVPNLKPISDTKLAKQSGTYSSPITFQQTFEQQLQTLQTDKKSKLLKMKAQVPKLVPATPKSFNSKPSTSGNKNTTIESKPSAALDLSTQTFDKAFETMQSIANLAKKQNLPTKGMPVAMSQSNVFTNMTRPLTTGVNPLGFPSTSNMNQMKIDKIGTSSAQGNINKQDTLNKTNTMKPVNNNSPTITPPSYQTPSHSSSNATQPSPRSQTRSPSSSPKLVIAEDKQVSNPSVEHNINQSNQITSTQLANINVSKNESPKPVAGPSKVGLKPLKPLSSAGKFTGMRQPIVPALNPNPPNMNNPNDYLRPQLMNAHVLLRQHMEWIKQRQYDFDLYKNTVTNMAHQNQNDFNNKDNKQ